MCRCLGARSDLALLQNHYTCNNNQLVVLKLNYLLKK